MLFQHSKMNTKKDARRWTLIQAKKMRRSMKRRVNLKNKQNPNPNLKIRMEQRKLRGLRRPCHSWWWRRWMMKYYCPTFLSEQKNEVRHIFVVPLNMDPSKITSSLSSDLKSITITYPVTKQRYDAKKMLKNIADLLVWQGAMAEQFEKRGKPARVTMRLTPSFLIGKFNMNVISN